MKRNYIWHRVFRKLIYFWLKNDNALKFGTVLVLHELIPKKKNKKKLHKLAYFLLTSVQNRRIRQNTLLLSVQVILDMCKMANMQHISFTYYYSEQSSQVNSIFYWCFLQVKPEQTQHLVFNLFSFSWSFLYVWGVYQSKITIFQNNWVKKNLTSGKLTWSNGIKDPI